MTTSRVVETSVTVNNRTKLTRAIVGHQFMKTQNERKRLRAHQEPCAHLTQVQAEKNMWDFNVIYVAAIHLRRAFMSVNVRKINSRFNFCYAAQPHGAATPCSNTEGRGWCLVVQYVGNNKVYLRYIKVMLHGAIRNDDFYRNTALQCWNNVVTIQNNIATISCNITFKFVL